MIVAPFSFLNNIAEITLSPVNISPSNVDFSIESDTSISFTQVVGGYDIDYGVVNSIATSQATLLVNQPSATISNNEYIEFQVDTATMPTGVDFHVGFMSSNAVLPASDPAADIQNRFDGNIQLRKYSTYINTKSAFGVTFYDNYDVLESGIITFRVKKLNNDFYMEISQSEINIHSYTVVNGAISTGYYAAVFFRDAAAGTILPLNFTMNYFNIYKVV